MIISHNHKFIFVAIPKTGSHSIREAIRPHLHQYDWEQCRLYEEKRFPIKDIALLHTGHLTTQQVEPFFPKGTWNKYYKFCFVRNPYDRFLSFCNFYFTKEMLTSPKKTMLDILNKTNKLPRQHQLLVLPQYKFIYDEELTCQVDFIGKVETLDEDFRTVCDQVSLPFGTLSKKNKSKEKISNFLDSELIYQLSLYYKIDFGLFDYPIIQRPNSDI